INDDAEVGQDAQGVDEARERQQRGEQSGDQRPGPFQRTSVFEHPDATVTGAPAGGARRVVRYRLFVAGPRLYAARWKPRSAVLRHARATAVSIYEQWF